MVNAVIVDIQLIDENGHWCQIQNELMRKLKFFIRALSQNKYKRFIERYSFINETKCEIKLTSYCPNIILNYQRY